MSPPSFNQQNEIDICINLINLIENKDISNQSILEHIHSYDYINLATLLDAEREKNQVFRQKDLANSLTKIITTIIDALENPKEDESPSDQRYRCNYLYIKERILQSCCNLDLSLAQLQHYIALCTYPILQFHLSLFAIEKALDVDDLLSAQTLINNIINVENHYWGWRLIANYHGKRGDKVNFLNVLKKCDARKDKFELECIKSQFVAVYSTSHSFTESIELINQKSFGHLYLEDVMRPYTETESLQTIQTMIDACPLLAENNTYQKETILAMAFKNCLQNRTKENFELLYPLIYAIPSRVSASYSDFSLRDNLFAQIADCLITQDKNLFKTEIDKTIKAINSAILKRNYKNMLKNEPLTPD